MQITDFIQQTLQDASSIAKQRFGKDGVFKTKSDQTDYVTKSDLLINDLITDKIKKTYPDHQIISEEDDSNHHIITTGELAEQDYWVLDPIDGTNNFATGIPLFGTMLCHFSHGKVTETGIVLPMLNEFYLAERGKGAFLNGERIYCTQKPEWKQTFGCTNANLSEKKALLRNALNRAWQESKFWLSAYGSAAVSGAFVAAGKRDWYLSMGSKIWDYAPITLLLEEAGCKISSIENQEWQPKDRSLVAANTQLHASLMSLISE